MRLAARYLSCLMMAITYVLAYMGVGIHTCHEDGSRHLFLMFGDVSCERIHHHSHGSDHDHHHGHGCCTTQVYVVTDAQDSTPDAAHFSVPEIQLPALAEAVTMPSVLPGHRTLLQWDSPPPEIPVTQSFLSVWKA